MRASESHNADVVKLLIEVGADVNLRNDEGETALKMANWGKGDIQTTNVLIAAGAVE